MKDSTFKIVLGIAGAILVTGILFIAELIKFGTTI